MPLPRQNIPVPLTKGLDESTDLKLSGGMLEAENVVFREQGSLETRDGYLTQAAAVNISPLPHTLLQSKSRVGMWNGQVSWPHRFDPTVVSYLPDAREAPRTKVSTLQTLRGVDAFHTKVIHLAAGATAIVYALRIPTSATTYWQRLQIQVFDDVTQTEIFRATDTVATLSTLTGGVISISAGAKDDVGLIHCVRIGASSEFFTTVHKIELSGTAWTFVQTESLTPTAAGKSVTCDHTGRYQARCEVGGTRRLGRYTSAGVDDSGTTPVTLATDATGNSFSEIQMGVENFLDADRAVFTGGPDVLVWTHAHNNVTPLVDRTTRASTYDADLVEQVAPTSVLQVQPKHQICVGWSGVDSTFIFTTETDLNVNTAAGPLSVLGMHVNRSDNDLTNVLSEDLPYEDHFPALQPISHSVTGHCFIALAWSKRVTLQNTVKPRANPSAVLVKFRDPANLNPFLDQPAVAVLVHNRYDVDRAEQTVVASFPLESPRAAELTTDNYTAVTGIRDLSLITQREANVRAFTVGWSSFTVDFDVSNLTGSQTSDVHFQASGLASHWDGEQLHELSLLSPPVVDGFITAAGGPTLEEGPYQWTAVIESVDRFGQLHRSAPAIPLFLDLSQAGNSEADLTVTWPCWRQSADRFLPRSGETNPTPYTVVIYRTQTGGTVFHELSRQVFDATDLGVSPVRTSHYDVSITDSVVDSEIVERPLLYTTGGGFEAQTLPPILDCEAITDRLWVIDAQDPKNIWFSKPKAELIQYEFNVAFRVRLPEDAVAISSSGITPVIFTANGIYTVQGDGPDALGNGVFSPPQSTRLDLGCTNPSSVLYTASGVFFESTRGLFITAPTGQVSHLGIQIQDRLQSFGPIAGAVNLEGTQEAVFRFSGASEHIQLVWNYEFGQWSQWALSPQAPDLRPVRDHISHDGVSSLLVPNSSLTQARYMTAQASKYDLGTNQPVNITIKTPWLALAQVDGYQRVRRVKILGESQRDSITFAFNSQLKITPFYDYDEAVSGATVTFDLPSSSTNTIVFPDFLIGPEHQKCKAIRFDITSNILAGDATAITLNQLLLEVGAKKGLFPAGTGTGSRGN